MIYFLLYILILRFLYSQSENSKFCFLLINSLTVCFKMLTFCCGKKKGCSLNYFQSVFRKFKKLKINKYQAFSFCLVISKNFKIHL